MLQVVACQWRRRTKIGRSQLSVLWSMFNWNEKELELKMFTKHKPHAGRNVDHTSPGLSVHSHHPRTRQRRNGSMCCCITLFAASAFQCIFNGEEIWGKRNMSLVTLTFDRPSEGPNTSSLWIWRKPVQRFWRYFIHKPINKKSQTTAKTEPYAVQCVRWSVNISLPSRRLSLRGMTGKQTIR